MSMLSNLELLLRVPLFSMLSGEQANLVAQAVSKRRVKRGETIVEQGRKTNALFILLSGRCRVVTTDSRGREVIIATLRPADCIGEMSLIDSDPAPAHRSAPRPAPWPSAARCRSGSSRRCSRPAAAWR